MHRRRAVGEDHEHAVRAVGDVADAGGDARPGLAGLGAGDGGDAEGQALAAEREDDDGVGGPGRRRRSAADVQPTSGRPAAISVIAPTRIGRGRTTRRRRRAAGQGQMKVPRAARPASRVEPGHGWIGVGGPARRQPAAATGTRHPWIGTLISRVIGCAGRRLRMRGGPSGRRLRTVDPGELVEHRRAVGRFGPAPRCWPSCCRHARRHCPDRRPREHREQQELGDRARATTEAIGRRMETYAQILRGAAGLYRASDTSRRRTSSGSSPAGPRRRYPGVAGVVHRRRSRRTRSEPTSVRPTVRSP